MSQTVQQSLLERFKTLVPVEVFDRYASDIKDGTYFGMPLEPIVRAEERLLSQAERSVAYFSMEYGLSTNFYNVFKSTLPTDPRNETSAHHVFSNLRAIDYYVTADTDHMLDLPIFSGGLGVLAGDTLKSTADLGVSLGAIGILWNKGYFKQSFWFKDGQMPEETDWDPSTYAGLVPLTTRVSIPLKKETIHLKLWKYYVYSHDHAHVVPLTLLDADLDTNSEFARKLTGQLYRSDNNDWKLYQRLILGIGGMKALQALGYAVNLYHLNEGHAALAFLERARGLSETDTQKLRQHFAYTCHTPVAAGHDRFSKKTVQEILPEDDYQFMKRYGSDPHHPDLLNLTQLAMTTCEHVNAVAAKHGEVTRLQFPQFQDRIRSITNGVHTHTWVSESMAQLFDRTAVLAGWRQDPTRLRRIVEVKDDTRFRSELWEAHQVGKKRLCRTLRSWRLHHDAFTICWARRIAAYKRPSLILQDAQRLVDIARKYGPIQVILAGKAHPKDDLGFTYVNDMLSSIDALEKDRDILRVMMLENYDTYFGQLLTGGVDVWLNNPLPPFEASGTSGMKAILNGVLQLTTLDGWVVEAADQDIGWIFGWRHETSEIGDERNLRLREDSDELYRTLEQAVSLYYHTVDGGRFRADSGWLDKMIHAIASAGFFNTHRMVAEYRDLIWKTA